MKKTLIILSTALCLFGCTDKKSQEEAANAKALAAATHEELVQAVQERDQLLDIVNEIVATTNEIKSAENIVSINNNSAEGKASQVQAVNDLKSIQAALAERQERLNELEQSIKNSKSSNNKLLATIQGLKSQIAQQSEEITSLTQRLSSANEQIAKLDTQVDSLSTEVRAANLEKETAQQEAMRQEDLANACYIAIGSKKELKEHNIIEGGGFLRKSKVLPSDFDKSFFTQADRRSLTSIPCHSSKAKIISKSQPEGSYEFVDDGTQKVLRILNPGQFWGTSNYLVIQID